MKDYAECVTAIDTLRRMIHDACLRKEWTDVHFLSERLVTVAVDLKNLAQDMTENTND